MINKFGDVEDRKKVFNMILEGKIRIVEENRKVRGVEERGKIRVVEEKIRIVEGEEDVTELITKELNTTKEEIENLIKIFAKNDILRKKMIIPFAANIITQKNLNRKAIKTRSSIIAEIFGRDVTLDVYELKNEKTLNEKEAEIIEELSAEEEKNANSRKKKTNPTITIKQLNEKGEIITTLYNKAKNGEPIEAQELECLETLMEKSKNKPITMGQLSYIYFSMKKYDKAERILIEVLKSKEINEGQRILMENSLREIRNARDEEENQKGFEEL